MDIEQLQHFVKVSETKNMTRASEEFGLTQPAISRSIQKLEDWVGQPLFERQSRQVVLTETGEFLLGRARQILTIIEETKNEIRDDGISGRIRLGAIPTIAPFFVPGLMQSFSKSFPSARLLVQEEPTSSLLTKLNQGEIDLALLALPISSKYLDVEKLFEEELLLALSSKHPLCKKKQIQIQDIKELPFILLDEAHCLTDNIQSFCQQRSFQPVSLEKTSQLATVQELVAIDHGVSLIPHMACARDTSKKREYRSLSGPKPTRVVAVVWNPYRFQSKLHVGFQSLLHEYAKEFRKSTE